MVFNVESEVSTPTKDEMVAMAARLSMTSKVSDSCFLLTVGTQVNIKRQNFIYLRY